MRGNYDANRKKIRGWKRRIKQPELGYFLPKGARFTYNRCYLHPFYTLNKRHTPLWFYKLIIAKFIAAYNAWEKVFDDLGVPYDLQLWLYDPSYIRSEIICYRMQEFGEMMKLSWEAGEQKPFPYHKFTSALYDLNEFDWVLAEENSLVFEDDFEYAEFTLEEILAEGYQRREQDNGEVYYVKRIGDEWIGRRKGKSEKSTKNRMWSYQAPPRHIDPEFITTVMKINEQKS